MSILSNLPCRGEGFQHESETEKRDFQLAGAGQSFVDLTLDLETISMYTQIAKEYLPYELIKVIFFR